LDFRFWILDFGLKETENYCSRKACPKPDKGAKDAKLEVLVEGIVLVKIHNFAP
jgi:hypothetical protein